MIVTAVTIGRAAPRRGRRVGARPAARRVAVRQHARHVRVRPPPRVPSHPRGGSSTCSQSPGRIIADRVLGLRAGAHASSQRLADARHRRRGGGARRRARRAARRDRRRRRRRLGHEAQHRTRPGHRSTVPVRRRRRHHVRRRDRGGALVEPRLATVGVGPRVRSRVHPIRHVAAQLRLTAGAADRMACRRGGPRPARRTDEAADSRTPSSKASTAAASR